MAVSKFEWFRPDMRPTLDRCFTEGFTAGYTPSIPNRGGPIAFQMP